MPLISVDPPAVRSAAAILQAVSDDIAGLVARLTGPIGHLDRRAGTAAGPAAAANEALREALERIGLGYGTLRLGLDEVATVWARTDRSALGPR